MKIVRRGRRPRRSPYSRYGWQAAGALASYGLNKAGRYIDNKVNSYVDSKSKSREMGPLTSEKDVRVTYRKRFMSRRKRRRYVRKLKGWQAMQMKSEPARIHFMVDARQYDAPANCSRYFAAMMGLMANNVYDTGMRNLWDNVEGPTFAGTRHAFLRIDHSSLTVVLRHVLPTVAPTTPIGLMDIDVYKIVCIRDVPLDRMPEVVVENMHASLKSEMRQATGMDIKVSDAGVTVPTVQTNAGTTVANQAVYDTLFNCPSFLRYFKILKCYKVQLGLGQTASFSWRDSKNYRIKRDESYAGEGASLACKRGFTKGFMFNINGRWTVTPGEFQSVGCICEHSVRYNYKPLVPISSDTLVYDGV